MKNSMFIFAAALFMLTSCTISEEDTPLPIKETEQNAFQAPDYRSQFSIYEISDSELSQIGSKKSNGEIDPSKNIRSFEELKQQSNRGDNEQGGPKKDGYGSSEALSIILTKHKMD